MLNDDIDKALALLRQGHTQEAITVLEAVRIARANRDRVEDLMEAEVVRDAGTIELDDIHPTSSSWTIERPPAPTGPSFGIVLTEVMPYVIIDDRHWECSPPFVQFVVGAVQRRYSEGECSEDDLREVVRVLLEGGVAQGLVKRR